MNRKNKQRLLAGFLAVVLTALVVLNQEGLELQASGNLFQDTFEGTALKTEWAAGTSGPVSYSVSDGVYRMEYDNTSTSTGTNTSYISSGLAWTDYAVSTDMSLVDDGYSTKTRVAGLVARKNGNSYYQFSIQLVKNTWTGYLYRYNKGTSTILGYFGGGVLAECLQDNKTLQRGVTYNLKLSVRGNVIQLFLNDALLYTYYDTDTNALTSGTAGLYASNNNVCFDNFTVEEKVPQVISSIRIADSSDNTFHLYEGADVNVCDYQLEVIYTDGSSDKISMTHEMLSEFDNTLLGTQEITLTYRGVSSPANVEIAERPDEITAFATMIEEFKSEITKEDVESFYALKEVYDSFSNYELAQIDAELLEKYMSLYEKLDKSLYSEIAEDTLLYDGYLDDEVAANWDGGREGSVGNWFVKNDMFHHAQRPYDIWGTGWRVPQLYGEISMISADMMLQNSMMYAALALNVGDVGYYQIRISGKSADADGNLNKILQIGVYQEGAVSYVKQCNVEIKENEWFNLCVTAVGGQIHAYLNGTLMLTYDDSQENCYTVGECGVRVSEGDALIDNIRIYGTEMAEKKDYEVTPTYYADDFEDESGPESSGEYLYTEDFSGSLEDLENTGWANSHNKFCYNVDNDELVYDISKTKNRAQFIWLENDNAYQWSDYTIEVDVTITDTYSCTADNNTNYANWIKNPYGWIGITVGSTTTSASTAKSGFEYFFAGYTSGKFQSQIKYRGGYDDAENSAMETMNSGYSLGTKYTLKVEIVDGAEGDTINCYVNGNLLNTLETSHQIVGTIGLHSQDFVGKFDNVRVYPTGDKNPSHWVETSVYNTVLDNWKVYEVNNSKVYGTTYKDAYTATWLHVFEDNPDVTMRFMINNQASDGTFGFVTRLAPMTAFVKIGYDVTTSKWYICSQRSESDGANYYYSDSTFELEEDKWYTAHLVEESNKVSFYIDNQLIVETDKVTQVSAGRLGVFTEGTSIFIDDVNCMFSGGDIPQDGIVSYDIMPEKNYNYMEIESLDENTLVGVTGGNKFLSTDAGLTWSSIVSDSAWNGLWHRGYYKSLLRLHDGTYLQIITSSSSEPIDSDDFTVESSQDLNTWTRIGRIINDSEATYVNGKSSPFIHVSAMTEVMLSDGTYRVFCPLTFQQNEGTSEGHYMKVYYSDDGGATWQSSTRDTRSILPGAEDNVTSSWTESAIIKGSDGVLRMYYSRNRLGCMQYTESYDGGVTWSGLYQIPEMQCPMSSFGIYEDPTEPGTFYMAWVNCKSSFLGNILPRTRLCLAKSTDGKNWEFLMNLEWTSDMLSPTNGGYLYQILDPSVMITEDYVYIAYGNSDHEYSKYTGSSHQWQMLHYTRIEKDKLQTRAWDASTIHDMTYPKSLEYEVAPQTTFGQGETFVIGKDVTLKKTNLAGEVTYENFIQNAIVYKEPDMNTLGKQMVQATYMNGYDLSYEVEIIPSYNPYLLTEDFSCSVEDLQNTGWDDFSLNYEFYDVINGELTWNTSITNQRTRILYLDQVNAYGWTNYTVEVDVTMEDAIFCPDNEKAPTKTSGWAGIFFGVPEGVSATYGDGLEYRVRYTGSEFLAELLNRSDAAGKKYYTAPAAPTAKTVTAALNQKYTLKVEVFGTTVKCYFDGEPCGTWDTGVEIVGTIGLRMQDIGCAFDNLRVYRMEAGSCVEEDFDGTIADLSNGTWTLGSTTYLSITDDEQLQIASKNKYVTLSAEERMTTWKDYVIEADVTLTETETTDNQSQGRSAGLVVVPMIDGVMSDSVNYELCVYHKTSLGSGKDLFGYCDIYFMDRTGSTSSSEKLRSWACKLGTSMKLKMVVRQTEIVCYVNSTEVGNFEIPTLTTGTVGLHTLGNVGKYDNFSVQKTLELEENCYEVAFYRKALTELIHPFKEGYVFGGWYTDADLTTPLDENRTTGRAYAKWVDANVLTVKAQIDTTTTAESTKTSMRFVSTVDCLDYDKVRFVINGKNYGESTTVYQKLLMKEGVIVSECQLSDFSTVSQYFTAVTLINIPLFKDIDGDGVQDTGETDYKDTAITVTSYWVTADGTTVFGVTRNDITINKGLAAISSQTAGTINL